MKPIEIEETPITDETFIVQNWERIVEEEDGTEFYYWKLPLPKDNPDEDAPSLISCANDEYLEAGIPQGTYVVEICEMNGLGYTASEEGLEVLYRVMTHRDINEPDEEEEITDILS